MNTIPIWVLLVVGIVLLAVTFLIYPTAGLLALVALVAAGLIWIALPEVMRALACLNILLVDILLSGATIATFGTTLGGIIGAALVAIAFSILLKIERKRLHVTGYRDWWTRYVYPMLHPRERSERESS